MLVLFSQWVKKCQPQHPLGSIPYLTTAIFYCYYHVDINSVAELDIVHKQKCVPVFPIPFNNIAALDICKLDLKSPIVNVCSTIFNQNNVSIVLLKLVLQPFVRTAKLHTYVQNLMCVCVQMG